MFNGDFTGLPRVSYYFTTSKEGQLKKKVRVYILTHKLYKHIHKIIYTYNICTYNYLLVKNLIMAS